MGSEISGLAREFAADLGPFGVLAGAEISARYSKDWGSLPPCPPALVLRPATTAEVSRVLRRCYERDLRLVVQGGLTGLCGGATPQPHEIALSTERLNRIEAIDALSLTAMVQSGVILEQLQNAAAAQGLLFPLDFGSRGSCTLGGNLACNAGGNSVIRYGVARELTLGLEAVLADGTVVSHLNTMTKNSSGFDLKHLFIGSEGSLGVITRAVVKLYPALAGKATAWVSLASLDEVLQLLRDARAELGAALTAFEVMWASFLREVARVAPQLRQPANKAMPFAVLLECEGDARVGARLEDFLAKVLATQPNADALLAQSTAQAAEFWAVRDGIAHIIESYSRAMNFDVSLPLTCIGQYEQRVNAKLRELLGSREPLWFGHLGDGTVHLTLDTPRDVSQDAMTAAILEPLQVLGGAVSAEHGIGIMKKKYLSLCRGAADIEQMRRLKHLLDPSGILNRGRVFDLIRP